MKEIIEQLKEELGKLATPIISLQTAPHLLAACNLIKALDMYIAELESELTILRKQYEQEKTNQKAFLKKLHDLGFL